MLAAVALPALAKAPPLTQRRAAMTEAAHRYEPVPFSAIAGWAEDDHLAAFEAFLKSCDRIAPQRPRSAPEGATAPRVRPGAEWLGPACAAALELPRGTISRSAARSFFESRFVPHRVAHPGGEGLVTGYYEPVLKGSRTAGGAFTTPIYRRPADLVNVVAETERGAKADALTHVRLTDDGRRVPYATRQEIDEGALAGRGLELLYLADPVDVFFMQVQGSGRIALPDGTMVRVTYDGKNGHPYTSVGRHLIDTGAFAAGQVSLKSLERWLKADPVRGRAAMWQNRSYVFFRELEGRQAQAPLGALSIPLSPGRSLAVDTAFHALGLPVWVSSPTLTHATRGRGFGRLMIAQDVGSAIRGPERGDIYFGSGDGAGRLAGITKHPASFIVLLPIPPGASRDALDAATPSTPKAAGP